MNRFEFTEVLRKSLSGRVDYRVVNENVAYYENYIGKCMRISSMSPKIAIQTAVREHFKP